MSDLHRAVPPYWRGVDGPPRRGLGTARVLASGFVRAGWRVRVHSRHHVPRSGPVILASNHAGFLDGPLLCAVTTRPVHALVKDEMFRGRVGQTLRRLGQIPVERHCVDIGAVRSSLAVLDRGDVLAIYPEGTRGTGDFAKIKPGVAYFALCTGAPVVPVACLGTRPADGSGGLPSLRTRVDVVFGAPVRLELTPWPRRRDVVREKARWLQDWLVRHLREACLTTGRQLPRDSVREEAVPGPLVAGRRLADEPELDVEDVS
jgi:1-acyl-sn-glycerol-3-phosphate acyltransferase